MRLSNRHFLKNDQRMGVMLHIFEWEGGREMEMNSKRAVESSKKEEKEQVLDIRMREK
jgi:hypothetical protein